MIKKLKVTIFAKFIFLLIALCFIFGIYLSIPVLFNYKSIENIIESKFYSDFDIKLNINGDIKYQLLPKPNLLISDSSLSISKKNNAINKKMNLANIVTFNFFIINPISLKMKKNKR